MPTHAAIVIVAWKKLSRRSELLAQALNIKLWFFKDNLPYARAFLMTLLKATRQKPTIVIVQLPQGPLLLCAFLLKQLIGCKVIADVHTGFLVDRNWKNLILNSPFTKLLSTTDLILVHGETLLRFVPPKNKNKTMVVFDPWFVTTNARTDTQTEQNGYIVFPASFGPDEPLEEVIQSITRFNLNVKMYVTGNWKRRPEIKKYASDRVVFTGFLPNEEYNSLLAESTAIISGTKREYTAPLMSAWEAVAYGKPLALSSTLTLKSMFKDYAVFYDWRNSRSIAETIEKILKSKPNDVAREKLKTRTIASVEMLKENLRMLASS